MSHVSYTELRYVTLHCCKTARNALSDGHDRESSEAHQAPSAEGRQRHTRPEIRDEILEDATALGEMGFSPILGSATVAGSPATGSEGDFLSSGLAILKV